MLIHVPLPIASAIALSGRVVQVSQQLQHWLHAAKAHKRPLVNLWYLDR